MWFKDNKPIDILSSWKVINITEDNFLLWIMMVNNNPQLDIKKYKVQIEEEVEECDNFELFDVISLLEFLKIRRPEFYEKYKLLLE